MRAWHLDFVVVEGGADIADCRAAIRVIPPGQTARGGSTPEWSKRRVEAPDQNPCSEAMVFPQISCLRVRSPNQPPFHITQIDLQQLGIVAQHMRKTVRPSETDFFQNKNRLFPSLPLMACFFPASLTRRGGWARFLGASLGV